MKYIYALVLFNTLSLFAMNAPTVTYSDLTDTEKECYEWFTEKQRTLPPFYQRLSKEDHEVLTKGLLYKDHPEAVARSRYNYADAFYDVAEENNLELKYDKEILKQALVKMTIMMQSKSIEEPTDLLSIRMYVHSQLLTDQEKAAYREENYFKKPKASKWAARVWSILTARKLIEKNLLDPEVAEEKAQELYEEHLARFEKHYGKNNV